MTMSSPPPASVQRRASASSPAPSSAAEQERRARDVAAIAELTRRLRLEHDEYERASESWTSEAGDRKREVRKAREGTLREIQAALVAAGMGDRAAEIEKLPFAVKLTELENLVRALTAPAVEPAPPAVAPSVHPVLAPSPLPIAVPASAIASAPPAPAVVLPSEGTPSPALSDAAAQAAVDLEASDAQAAPVAHTSIFARSHARPESPVAEHPPRRGVGRATLGIRIGAGLVGLAIALGGWHVAHRGSDSSADVTPSPPPSVQTASAEVLEPPLPSPRVEAPDDSPEAPVSSGSSPGASSPALTPPSRHPTSPLPRLPRVRPNKPGQQPAGTRATRAQEANSNPY
jgi:hypothetical protein